MCKFVYRKMAEFAWWSIIYLHLYCLWKQKKTFLNLCIRSLKSRFSNLLKICFQNFPRRTYIILYVYKFFYCNIIYVLFRILFFFSTLYRVYFCLYNAQENFPKFIYSIIFFVYDILVFFSFPILAFFLKFISTNKEHEILQTKFCKIFLYCSNNFLVSYWYAFFFPASLLENEKYCNIPTHEMCNAL